MFRNLKLATVGALFLGLVTVSSTTARGDSDHTNYLTFSRAVALPGVAPAGLPFEGGAATPLAERHAAQMRSRQVSLGFATAPEIAARTPQVPAMPGTARESRYTTRKPYSATMLGMTKVSRAVLLANSGPPYTLTSAGYFRRRSNVDGN